MRVAAHQRAFHTEKMRKLAGNLWWSLYFGSLAPYHMLVGLSGEEVYLDRLQMFQMKCSINGLNFVNLRK